jgi:hypothetical protein
MAYDTQLIGEDAEDQNATHILTSGASSERPKGVTSTSFYIAPTKFIAKPTIATTKEAEAKYIARFEESTAC